MQAAIVPSINNNAYIIRVLVLLRHVGHWEQQKLQAVLPQRQASYIIKYSNQYKLDISIYFYIFIFILNIYFHVIFLLEKNYTILNYLILYFMNSN